MNQLGTMYLSETAEKRRKKKKFIKPDQVFWITAGVYGTVFFGLLYLAYLAHNGGSTKSAGSPSFILFFFSHSFFTSPPLGLGLFQQTSFSLNSIYTHKKRYLYHLYLLQTSLALNPLFNSLYKELFIITSSCKI